MNFTIGQKVVTIRAIGALRNNGSVDLAEGTKGTYLGTDGEVACVEIGGDRHYFAIDAIKGSRGRPRKADTAPVSE